MNRQPNQQPSKPAEERAAYIAGARRQIDQALASGLINKAQAKEIWIELLNSLGLESN